MELMYLIDKLEDLVASAKKMPITGRTMIDGERLAELVEQLRFSVPKNVQEATEVIEHRSDLISQTANEVRRLRATAERESRMLVEESTVLAAAKEKGDAIIREAEEQAKLILARTETEAKKRQRGANAYTRDTLLELEAKVSEILDTTRKGVAALTSPEERTATAVAAEAIKVELVNAAPSNGNGASAGAAS